jgi:hypothetical protein
VVVPVVTGAVGVVAVGEGVTVPGGVGVGVEGVAPIVIVCEAYRGGSAPCTGVRETATRLSDPLGEVPRVIFCVKLPLLSAVAVAILVPVCWPGWVSRRSIGWLPGKK